MLLFLLNLAPAKPSDAHKFKDMLHISRAAVLKGLWVDIDPHCGEDPTFCSCLPVDISLLFSPVLGVGSVQPSHCLLGI